LNKEIKLPDLGEGIEGAEVSEVKVSVGDKLKPEDTILVLESDKASMEIPAEVIGVATKVAVKVGDHVQPGQLLVSVDVDNKIEQSEEKKETKSYNKKDISEEVETDDTPELSPINNAQNKDNVFASPGVRRLARELNINLAFIKGNGPKGRITKDDLHHYIKIQMAMSSDAKPLSKPEIDFSQWGEVEVKKLTKINIITGQRLQQAWQSIPHVTQFDEADISELNKYRNKMNKKSATMKTKLTFLPFFMKAAITVLKEMPKFNSSLDHNEENLILKNYYNLGIAVDTPYGLIVPVIRDVDKKSLIDLSEELIDLSQRARDKKLKPSELTSGTFTISSLGGIGGKFFTPIINPPEVAILGISQSWWNNIYNEKTKSHSPGYIMPFSLSYDHRVIDGASGAAFTSRFAEVLSGQPSLLDK
jgi:pyruvate dehydrogenase E2 component (dihydrolipoamide acetyltransferase)